MPIRIPSRTALVAAARFAISDAVTKTIAAHDLTYAELTHILAQELLAWSGYAIRDERSETDAHADGTAHSGELGHP